MLEEVHVLLVKDKIFCISFLPFQVWRLGNKKEGIKMTQTRMILYHFGKEDREQGELVEKKKEKERRELKR